MTRDSGMTHVKRIIKGMERNRLIQDLIGDFIFQNAVRLRDREQHAKDQAEDKGDGA